MQTRSMPAAYELIYKRIFAYVFYNLFGMRQPDNHILAIDKNVLLIQNSFYKISDHQQSQRYEDDLWKAPGPPLLVAADFIKMVSP